MELPFIFANFNFRLKVHFHPFCQTPVLGLELGVDFTFTWDKNSKNPNLDFLKGTVLGDKVQGVGIRDKDKG